MTISPLLDAARICVWLLVLLGATLGSTAVVRLLLGHTVPRAALLPAGFVLAVVGADVSAMLLLRILPMKVFLNILAAAGLLAGILTLALMRRAWRQAAPTPPGTTALMTWGITPTWLAVSAAVLALVALHALSMSHYAHSGVARENLFFHSAVAGQIALDGYPPRNPLEPDYPFVYRYAYHVLGALVQGALDIAPPRALALVNVFSLTGAASLLMAIGMRYFRSWKLGLLSAIIFVYGGSLEWLQAISLEAWRWSDLGRGLHFAPDSGLRIVSDVSDIRIFYKIIGGILAAGNPLDMVDSNPSISFGYPVWLLTAWLYAEARKARCRRGYLTLALVGVLLAFLFSANEILFGALVGAILTTELGSFLLGLRRRSGRLATSRLALSLCIVVASLVGNALLGGSVFRAFFDPDAGTTYRLVLNHDHLGQLVDAPSKGWGWQPIASTSFVLQSVFLLPLGPLLVALALFSGVGGTITALFGLSAGFALGGGALVYPEAFPPDSYRFSQAAFSIWPATAVLLVGGLLQRWSASTKLITSVGARVLSGALVLALIGGHFIWLQALPGPGVYSQSSQPPPGLEVAAADSLRVIGRPTRLLVVGGAECFGCLYQNSPHGLITARILGFSGASAPMGHTTAYGQPHLYAPFYVPAARTLDWPAVQRLRIEYIYADDRLLNQSQRAALAQRLATGEISERARFAVGNGPAGSSARLYKVVSVDQPAQPAVAQQ